MNTNTSETRRSVEWLQPKHKSFANQKHFIFPCLSIHTCTHPRVLRSRPPSGPPLPLSPFPSSSRRHDRPFSARGDRLGKNCAHPIKPKIQGKFHVSIRGKVSWKQRGLNVMRPREILPAMVWGKEDGTYACRATLASHRLRPSFPGKWSTQHLYRASPGCLLQLSWWGDLPRLPC